MNLDALCAAVWEAPDWLSRFTRRGYEAAFVEYCRRFGPLYTQAVREAAEKAGDLAELTGALLDGLETGWHRHHFWNRGGIRVNEKQVIVNYLSPMLLEQEEPLCAEFAKALRREWKKRWPKDAYHITSYAALKGGFRNAIMGIDLANQHIRGGNELDEDDEA